MDIGRRRSLFPLDLNNNKQQQRQQQQTHKHNSKTMGSYLLSAVWFFSLKMFMGVKYHLDVVVNKCVDHILLIILFFHALFLIEEKKYEHHHCPN